MFPNDTGRGYGAGISQYRCSKVYPAKSKWNHAWTNDFRRIRPWDCKGTYTWRNAVICFDKFWESKWGKCDCLPGGFKACVWGTGGKLLYYAKFYTWGLTCERKYRSDTGWNETYGAWSKCIRGTTGRTAFV